MCKLFKLNRSWYYEWKNRLAQTEKQETELKPVVEAIVKDFAGYGVRRVTHQLQIWLEIQVQGYTGSLSSVYRALKYFPQPEGSENTPVKQIPSPKLAHQVRRLSARRACWLLLHEQEKLKPGDLEMRKILLELSPVAVVLLRLSQRFKEILKNQQVEDLEN